MTSIYCAALSRAALPPATLARKPNFSLYMDEFPSYTHRAFGDIVAEARKYKLNLTIAHQYIEQVEEEVRSAVFGNVGTLIVFRVGSFDAEIFEKEFAPACYRGRYCRLRCWRNVSASYDRRYWFKTVLGGIACTGVSGTLRGARSGHREFAGAV